MERFGSWTTSWVEHRSRPERCSCRSTECAPRNNWRAGTADRGRFRAPATSRSARRTRSYRSVRLRTDRAGTRRRAAANGGGGRRHRARRRSPSIPRSRFSARGVATLASAERTTWAMSSRDSEIGSQASQPSLFGIEPGPEVVACAAGDRRLGRRPSMPRRTTATRPRACSPWIPRNNVVLEASAGTGKTSVLVASVREPAEGGRRAGEHPRDHIHAKSCGGDARTDRRASCGTPRRAPRSTRRDGASCAIGSARSPSARSTRSACRSCASFRSRRTWIPGSRWPTRRRCRG